MAGEGERLGGRVARGRWWRAIHPPCRRAVGAALVVVSLLAGVPAAPVADAQTAGAAWGEATNLSQSGSGSQPVVVAGSGDTAQAFWWDMFDGLMSAHYDGEGWSPAVPAPVAARDAEWEEGVPLGFMPEIVADGRGGAHALWLLERAGEGHASRVLLHSVLAIGAATWSPAQVVASSVVGWEAFADPAGRLHVVYVSAQNAPDAPPGIYHRRYAPGQDRWSVPGLVRESLYARLLTAEDLQLAGAADDAGNVNVAWYDPRNDTMWIARSPDGGRTWAAPVRVPVADAVSTHLAATGRGEFLALWRVSTGDMTIALFQQRSRDGGNSWDEPLRVLPTLAAPGDEILLQQMDDGRLLLAAGLGGYGLALARWSAPRAPGEGASGWSDAQSIALAVRDTETGSSVSLEALRLAVGGGHLTIVGEGQDGEVWAIRRAVSTLIWEQEESGPWSPVVDISQARQAGLPTIAVDPAGRVHAMWVEVEAGDGPAALMYSYSDGSGWASPVQVLQSPEAEIDDLSLVVGGGRLHALWSSGQEGLVFYSRAYSQHALAPSSWSEVHRLPVPPGTGGVIRSPQLRADLGGRLHLVYAVPLNEGRGVYYLRSDDEGDHWSQPTPVFDAAAARWPSVGQPALAIDVGGTIYVAWARLPLLPGEPEGVYLASSHDGSVGWSNALAIAEGETGAPLLGVTGAGQVHLLWRESGGEAWWHGWSPDGGRTWPSSVEVRGFAGLEAPPSLSDDHSGTLHLLGVAYDALGDPLLRYTAWTADARQWGEVRDVRMAGMGGGAARLVAALLADRGLLDVLIQTRDAADGRGSEQRILHTRRSVPAVGRIPALRASPVPSAAPTVEPTHTPQPTLKPAVASAPPEATARTVRVGPLSLPLHGVGGLMLSVLLVCGAYAMHLVRARGR